MRLIEWGTRLRVALFALPYGDQAIFVRREVLESFGGVPDVRLMEDLDLVAAIKRTGKLAVLEAEVTTSARRYARTGVLRTFATHIVALLSWRLGLPRERVARWAGR